MPWEISLIHGDDRKPLGSRRFVMEAVAEALPGARLELPPAMPNHILEQMPPILREAITSRTKLEAIFEGPDFWIELYTEDSDPITYLNAEVRGNGDPFPALAALCAATGWSVWDPVNETVVDLSQPDRSGWRKFCEYRDRAIGRIQDEE